MLKKLSLIFVLAVLMACNGKKHDVVAIKPVPQKISEELEPVIMDEKTALVDSFFQDLAAKNDFNGTALVSRKGKIIYKKAFGVADYETGKPLASNSVFQLASVSKQFTAMAVMMLKEQGKLNYDDDVRKYISNFPYADITIRHLLTHRSGLPNYIYFCENYVTDKSKPITNNDVLNMLAVHKPETYYRPNKRYHYSNTGYIVLASIIEKITGTPFDIFMKKSIFDPTGMYNTFVYSKAKENKLPNAVTGYNLRHKKADIDYLNGVMGDKGVYSTVEDLFRWDKALYTDKLVKQTTLQEAFTPSNTNLKNVPINYGFGWRTIANEDGSNMVYHGGWWQGFTSYYLHNPNDTSAVIVLCNSANGCVKNVKKLEEKLNPAYSISASNKTKKQKKHARPPVIQL